MKTKNKKNPNPISQENILLSLASENCYVRVNENDSTDIQLYYVEERGTDRHFTLSSLNYALSNILRGDVEFQRDSDDHKSGENEDFVLDYISGHYMGDITLWNHPEDNRKWIINGKHRLTALQDFYNGNLVLKGTYAKRFWTHFLPDIIAMIGRGNTEFNQVLLSLSNGTYPQVRYNDLPLNIKEQIIASVAISSTEVSIVCKNLDGSIRQDGNIEIMKEIIWNKFFNMNNNIAVIKVEDTLWASLSHYTRATKRMAFFKVFREFFDIKTIEKKVNGVMKTSLDEYKKLNEVLMMIMYFIDGKHTWNGSTKALSKKVNQTSYRFMQYGAESKLFVSYFTKGIQTNFTNMFQGGETLNLPQGVKGIKGNLTNIRYMIYFMYTLHKITAIKTIKTIPSFKLYFGDVPTPIHRAILEMAANIIVSSNFNDTSEITESHPIYQNGLGAIYEENKSVFIRFNEYRRSQRTKDVIDELMIDLCNLCSKYVS